MKSNEIQEYLEIQYPIVTDTDDNSKHINMLMAVRRTAFTEGAKYIMNMVSIL